MFYCTCTQQAHKIARGLITYMDPTWLGAKMVGGRMRGYTALMCCANGSDRALKRRELVAELIEARAKVDARDEKGRTAFLHAVGTGIVDVARLLIVMGANPDAKSDDGRNAGDRCRGSSNLMRRFLVYCATHGASWPWPWAMAMPMGMAMAMAMAMGMAMAMPMPTAMGMGMAMPMAMPMAIMVYHPCYLQVRAGGIARRAHRRQGR